MPNEKPMIPPEIFEQGLEAVIKYCADHEIDISMPVSKGL